MFLSVSLNKTTRRQGIKLSETVILGGQPGVAAFRSHSGSQAALNFSGLTWFRSPYPGGMTCPGGWTWLAWLGCKRLYWWVVRVGSHKKGPSAGFSADGPGGKGLRNVYSTYPHLYIGNAGTDRRRLKLISCIPDRSQLPAGLKILCYTSFVKSNKKGRVIGRHL